MAVAEGQSSTPTIGAKWRFFLDCGVAWWCHSTWASTWLTIDSGSVRAPRPGPSSANGSGRRTRNANSRVCPPDPLDAVAATLRPTAAHDALPLPDVCDPRFGAGELRRSHDPLPQMWPVNNGAVLSFSALDTGV